MLDRKSTTRLAKQSSAVTLCAAVALSALLAAPAFAQTAAVPPAPPQATSPAAAPATSPAPAQPIPATAQDAPLDTAGLVAKLGQQKAATVEGRITKLHADLKITPAQEQIWQPFASAMRSNAADIDAVLSRREQNYAGMNAVEDLKSYAEVESVSARDVAGLLPPFEALYAALTPAQQKQADQIFIRHIDRAVKKGHPSGG